MILGCGEKISAATKFNFDLASGEEKERLNKRTMFVQK